MSTWICQTARNRVASCGDSAVDSYINWDKEETLRRDLSGEGFGAGGGEREADQPFAGDAAGADFRRSEFPAAEGFLRGVGEILAGSRTLEFGRGDVAGGVHVSAESDANFARNGSERFFGNVGQDGVEHFAFSG